MTEDIATDKASRLVCLLIDDDEDDRDIFGIGLKDTGIPCMLVTAASGREALELLADEKFNPDFIFLDLNMPGMHGTKCLREIKNIPRLNHIPVIIYSTTSNPIYEEETKAMGASHFLIKPINIKDLSYNISAILRDQEAMPFSLNDI